MRPHEWTRRYKHVWPNSVEPIPEASLTTGSVICLRCESVGYMVDHPDGVLGLDGLQIDKDCDTATVRLIMGS